MDLLRLGYEILVAKPLTICWEMCHELMELEALFIINIKRHYASTSD